MQPYLMTQISLGALRIYSSITYEIRKEEIRNHIKLLD